jgi:hypothetical protein
MIQLLGRDHIALFGLPPSMPSCSMIQLFGRGHIASIWRRWPCLDPWARASLGKFLLNLPQKDPNMRG